MPRLRKTQDKCKKSPAPRSPKATAEHWQRCSIGEPNDEPSDDDPPSAGMVTGSSKPRSRTLGSASCNPWFAPSAQGPEAPPYHQLRRKPWVSGSGTCSGACSVHPPTTAAWYAGSPEAG